jgi:hypothetical protein
MEKNLCRIGLGIYPNNLIYLFSSGLTSSGVMQQHAIQQHCILFSHKVQVKIHGKQIHKQGSPPLAVFWLIFYFID